MVGSNSQLVDAAVLLLRLTVGVILFVAGSGKLFGWFGGYGMEATIKGFETGFHIPAFLTYISTYTEFLGGILIALGLLTRLAGAAVTINMLVATIVVIPMGFMSANGGFAFPLCVLALSAAVLITGPLKYSLDQVLFGRKK